MTSKPKTLFCRKAPSQKMEVREQMACYEPPVVREMDTQLLKGYEHHSYTIPPDHIEEDNSKDM